MKHVKLISPAVKPEMAQFLPPASLGDIQALFQGLLLLWVFEFANTRFLKK